MARNRQRAKERQAERRAARQAGEEPVGNNAGAGPDPDPPFRSEAPPEELGRSDYTLEHTSEEEEFIGDLQVQEPGEPDEFAPRGVRGGREQEEHDHHERGRVTGFLHAVWLELQRVQWPDRPTLTSLTGITLMFVLIVGGYLGLLDAVFSKLVQAIL
jgi:preprotein translocase SecE subunit